MKLRLPGKGVRGKDTEPRRPSWERDAQRGVVLGNADVFTASTRAARRRTLVRWGYAAMALALLGGLVWLVAFSSVLTLRTVSVEGVDEPLAATIEEQLDAPIGKQLSRVDLAVLERRAESVADVKSAEVSRVWPTGIRIDIAERTPVATVKLNKRWRFVDDSGVSFGLSAKKPADLVVIDASAGGGPLSDTAAAVDVLNRLPDAIASQLGSIRVTSAADVQLILTDGTTVVWGTAERSDRKAEVLLALLPQGATMYDVSAPDRPALRGLPDEAVAPVS